MIEVWPLREDRDEFVVGRQRHSDSVGGLREGGRRQPIFQQFEPDAGTPDWFTQRLLGRQVAEPTLERKLRQKRKPRHA